MSDNAYIGSVEIGPSERGGRGVFALEDIPEGDVIETAPVIVLPDKDCENAESTVLQDYLFCNDDDKSCM